MAGYLIANVEVATQKDSRSTHNLRLLGDHRVERRAAGRRQWIPKMGDVRILQRAVYGGDMLPDFGVIDLRVANQKRVDH